jgi:peptide/nickel transport system substrate-binding protein
MIKMPEEATRIASIKTGLADMIDVSMAGAKELENAGYRMATLDQDKPWVSLYGTYDSRAGATGDVRVRHALSLAINRDELAKTFFDGKLGPVMPSLISPNAPDIDIAYWRDYAAKAYAYDPDQAKSLLSQAGYPNGFNIKMYASYSTGSPYLPDLAVVIQAYWAKIGVKCDIINIDNAALQKMTYPPLIPPDPAVIGQAGMNSKATDAITARSLFSGFHSQGTRGLLGKNADLDKLISDAMAETDTAKRRDLLAQGIKITTDSYTALMFGMVPVVCAIGPRVDITFPSPAFAIPLHTELATHRK